MADIAYRATPQVMLHQNPKALVPHQRMGMWCESLLSTSGLRAQLRSFATKVKNVRFDKFGRKIDSARKMHLAIKMRI